MQKQIKSVDADSYCACRSKDEARCTYRFGASLGGEVCGKTKDDPEAYHDDKDPEPCCGWHQFTTEQSQDEAKSCASDSKPPSVTALSSASGRGMDAALYGAISLVKRHAEAFRELEAYMANHQIVSLALLGSLRVESSIWKKPECSRCDFTGDCADGAPCVAHDCTADNCKCPEPTVQAYREGQRVVIEATFVKEIDYVYDEGPGYVVGVMLTVSDKTVCVRADALAEQSSGGGKHSMSGIASAETATRATGKAFSNCDYDITADGCVSTHDSQHFTATAEGSITSKESSEPGFVTVTFIEGFETLKLRLSKESLYALGAQLGFSA
jgi:hypothetical protein